MLRTFLQQGQSTACICFRLDLFRTTSSNGCCSPSFFSLCTSYLEFMPSSRSSAALIDSVVHQGAAQYDANVSSPLGIPPSSFMRCAGLSVTACWYSFQVARVLFPRHSQAFWVVFPSNIANDIRSRYIFHRRGRR